MAQQYLKGKVAIVTGAGKLNGIGAQSAIALAEQGANVRFCLLMVSGLVANSVAGCNSL